MPPAAAMEERAAPADAIGGRDCSAESAIADRKHETPATRSLLADLAALLTRSRSIRIVSEALETAKMERYGIEARLQAVERALRQAIRETPRPEATALASASTVGALVGGPAGGSAAAPVGAAPSEARAQLTEEQMQRAAASRAAALERKRQRERTTLPLETTTVALQGEAPCQ